VSGAARLVISRVDSKTGDYYEYTYPARDPLSSTVLFSAVAYADDIEWNPNPSSATAIPPATGGL
jgi:hypothetical protein